MLEQQMPRRKASRLATMVGVIFSVMLLVILVQALAAQDGAGLAAELHVEKSVAQEITYPNGHIDYTIIISNSGDTAASNVMLTDTLPAELNYVADSLEVVGGAGVYGVANNVITWTGSISPDGEMVHLMFSGMVTDTAVKGDTIANMVTVSGEGSVLTDTAVTAIQTTFNNFLPVIAKSYPIPAAPVLNPVGIPTSVNGFQNFYLTASWNSVAGDAVTYVLQTARQADFSDALDHNVGGDTSYTGDYPGSTNTAPFYFRVRAIDHGMTSGWSNVQLQHGVYNDWFDSAASGWSIRREDTDDVDNDSYYENGNFVMKIRGRWDYAMAAPMAQVPWPSYSVSTNVRFDPTADNLHTYGLTFGGDWNGQPCPNVDYTSCFNHYYRLIVVWFGHDTDLKIQLKRIDYHDVDNVGRGVTLMEFRDVPVGNPNTFNTWRIDVHEDGEIAIYVDDRLIYTIIEDPGDISYVGAGTYPSVFAASNEYSGAEPWFDWFRISPLP